MHPSRWPATITSEREIQTRMLAVRMARLALESAGREPVVAISARGEDSRTATDEAKAVPGGLYVGWLSEQLAEKLDLRKALGTDESNADEVVAKAVSAEVVGNAIRMVKAEEADVARISALVTPTATPPTVHKRFAPNVYPFAPLKPHGSDCVGADSEERGIMDHVTTWVSLNLLKAAGTA